MATVINFACVRANDSGGSPASYACTLQLTDDAILGSSGTWKVGGASPKKVFVAQSGNWVKTSGQITLNSTNGSISERVIMQNPEAPTGTLKGDGLVGGHIVNWTRT
jgi:hypothetical protein